MCVYQMQRLGVVRLQKARMDNVVQLLGKIVRHFPTVLVHVVEF